METKELMIGDFVEYEYHITAMISLENNVITKEEKTYTRIIKVATVNPNHVDYIVKNAEGLDIYTAALKENLKPIPITPKILEKNGFMKENLDIVLRDEFTEDKLISLIKIAKGFALITDGMTIGIQYVHELQHIYKLCGIKKEIEL